MFLNHLSLQHFRSYSKTDFDFSENTTFIVGPNTSGKTNIIEALYLLSFGKSFRAEKDIDVIQFGNSIARVEAFLEPVASTSEVRLRPRHTSEVNLAEQEKLEVVIAGTIKKYLVNGVSKRRADFASLFKTVLFSPLDLDIVSGSPSHRRNFLDEVLEQVDRDYRIAIVEYTKALRQRNALLERAKNTRVYSEKQFEYWDEILIRNGSFITKKREECIAFLNREKKDIFDFIIAYDKSVISNERLLQYKDAERGAGVTLVGPHRDDFSLHMFNNTRATTHDVKIYGSRGQQRLAVLQLKLLQLLYIEKTLGERPTLLLDDIFSELDAAHIRHVLDMMGRQQTICTTTHKEFIPKKLIDGAKIIELGRSK